MNISVHLSGCVVAYEPNTRAPKPKLIKDVGQGSLVNYQKRQIADAVEWIRLNAVHKPLIFVATSPGFTRESNEPLFISKLCHNLRNGYGIRNYVWVRELTKMGYPHFHFVADSPWINDVVGLSRYWSSLFDRDDPNSIRLGSKPQGGKRKFYIENSSMAWYLSKYLGKGLGLRRSFLCEAGFPDTNYKKTFRQFAISQQAALMSAPVTFEQKIHFQQPDEMMQLSNGSWVQKPAICTGRTFSDPSTGTFFNHHEYVWKQHPMHKVFFGIKKEIKQQLAIFTP